VRVAVVTGASSGIGAALCRALRQDGWHVVGLSRRPSPDADEHEECNVADRAWVEAVAARVLERHPRIDLLVNNAGVSLRDTYLEGDPERIEAVIRTNYLGSVWCLRAFLPGLGPGARLVNVVSVAGAVAGGPYSASKHAQLAFSRSVTVELASRDVAVLGVLPGFVETPGFPQHQRFGGLGRRLVVEPTLVAKRILEALESGKREIFVPRWYRPVVWVQAVAPGLAAGLVIRARSRRLGRRV
jgi:NAD(P)-dependent dehydrogenase (short-subunit alcohol dehydrogenase family)